MLCSRRTTNETALTTASLAVCWYAESVGVAGASSPREPFTPVQRGVVVERRLEVVARADVGSQPTQIYHRQQTRYYFLRFLILVDFLCLALIGSVLSVS